MAEIVSWVSDKLYDLIGLSDRQVAEYVTELARRSVSSEELTRKLRSTAAITMSSSVEAFAVELWSKFPREQALGKPGSNVPSNQKPMKKVHYKLLLDDEPLESSGTHITLKDDGRRRKASSRNIRSQKSSSWESDEEDTRTHTPSTLAVDEGSGSDSDEWERWVPYVYTYLIGEILFIKMCVSTTMVD